MSINLWVFFEMLGGTGRWQTVLFIFSLFLGTMSEVGHKYIPRSIQVNESSELVRLGFSTETSSHIGLKG